MFVYMGQRLHMLVLGFAISLLQYVKSNDQKRRKHIWIMLVDRSFCIHTDVRLFFLSVTE